MQTITVVINNHDLLTWPRAMVADIASFSSVGDIVFVDNGSTYPPLLDWHSTLAHRVIRLPNVGHKAPWLPEVKQAIKTQRYVVSDPDLDLSRTPRDCLDHLSWCLDQIPQAGKMGLGLEHADVPPDSPCFASVTKDTAIIAKRPIFLGVIRAAPTDTTFAIYDKALLDDHKVGGGQTMAPYTARHLPWYVIEPDDELAYYLRGANASSTYARTSVTTGRTGSSS